MIYLEAGRVRLDVLSPDGGFAVFRELVTAYVDRLPAGRRSEVERRARALALRRPTTVMRTRSDPGHPSAGAVLLAP